MKQEFTLQYLKALWFSDLDDNYSHWVYSCNLCGYKVTNTWRNGMPVLERMQ